MEASRAEQIRLDRQMLAQLEATRAQCGWLFASNQPLEEYYQMLLQKVAANNREYAAAVAASFLKEGSLGTTCGTTSAGMQLWSKPHHQPCNLHQQTQHSQSLDSLLEQIMADPSHWARPECVSTAPGSGITNNSNRVSEPNAVSPTQDVWGTPRKASMSAAGGPSAAASCGTALRLPSKPRSTDTIESHSAELLLSGVDCVIRVSETAVPAHTAAPPQLPAPGAEHTQHGTVVPGVPQQGAYAPTASPLNTHPAGINAYVAAGANGAASASASAEALLQCRGAYASAAGDTAADACSQMWHPFLAASVACPPAPAAPTASMATDARSAPLCRPQAAADADNFDVFLDWMLNDDTRSTVYCF